MRAVSKLSVVLLVIVSGSLPLAAGDGDFSLDPSALSLTAGRLYDDGTRVSEAQTFTAEPEASATGVGGGPSIFGGVAPLTLGASDGLLGTYFAAKVGPVWYLGDFDELDVGIWAEGALGIRLLSILALEFQSGYFYGDFDGGILPNRGKLWGVPVTLNAKVTLPILFLKLYGGVGVGAYYVDTEVNVAGQRFDNDDWGVGGQAFLGALFEIAGIGLGLEGKYILTENVDVAGGGRAKLEGAALLAVLQIAF